MTAFGVEELTVDDLIRHLQHYSEQGYGWLPARIWTTEHSEPVIAVDKKGMSLRVMGPSAQSPTVERKSAGDRMIEDAERDTLEHMERAGIDTSNEFEPES